jgi:F-type H+-transporting ATPase subunit delta
MVKSSARRYARAIFELSEKDTITIWQADLNKIAQICKDETIAAYLENPSVHLNDKAKLLREWLGDINQKVLNLVFVLINKSKLEMINDIATEYQRLVDDYQGIERVVVTTASPLDDDTRFKLSKDISRLIGRKVVLENEYVDANLIGGVVVKVAGKLLDGSTKGKLAALNKEIS